MADVRKDQVEVLRESLEDVILIIDRVGSFCGSIEELRGMLELALTNDAQCKILSKITLEIKK